MLKHSIFWGRIGVKRCQKWCQERVKKVSKILSNEMVLLLENRVVDGKKQIVWKQAPMPFLFNNFQQIVDNYFGLITLCDYDPQKVGKAAQSYQQVLQAVKMALLLSDANLH